MGPGGLRELTASVAPGSAEPPFVLVGLQQPDDAAVVALGTGPAAVLTTDLITPACDDPFLFGQLAAANALSDVYAMGGTPLAALNICCFPDDDVCPADVKAQILAGMAERVRAAGAAVVGGHTVRDPELKAGLSVMGRVDPARILRKGGLQAGQALILTRPLGIGMLIGGYRKDLISAAALEEALRAQVMLNADAADVALQFGATGCTDVTGFGLGGHGLEMARGAGATLVVHVPQVPMLPAALPLALKGVTSRGAKENAADAGADVVVEDSVPAERRAICFDPQTSGGLLFGVAPDRAQECVTELHRRGMTHAAVIGRVEAGPPQVRLLMRT